MELRTAEEILEELLPPLEALETQSGAVLQFLKDKGITTDEQLAPYLEQARNASNIRWRAARLRINRLLAAVFETAEKSRESNQRNPQQNRRANHAPSLGSKRQRPIEQPNIQKKERVSVRLAAPHLKKARLNRPEITDDARESRP